MPLPGDLVYAIRFLTILRVRDAQETMPQEAMAPDWLARAMKYFPIVGAGVGAVSAIVLLVAAKLWGPTLAALLAVAASIIFTSALHEDGLADTADAFGGGWTREKRLAIMKDSRIGTYGALALGLGVALRVAALAALPPTIAAAALIALHAAARAMPALAMNNMNYAGDTAAMKVSYAETPVRRGELQFALAMVALAALPLLLISFTSAIAGWICGATLALLLAIWSRRLIGGYTGDVLGAIEQVYEIGFLLGVAAVIR
jgi:adenosylcobinamide-GDP ribazoletransferase